MQWSTNTYWFEVAVVSIAFLMGHIFLGHFEERTSTWRKFFKYLISLAIVLSISISFGRIFGLGILAIAFIPVIYIHAVLLPKRGINGWTGEPKSTYYDFRGWSKDIFNKNSPNED